MRNEEGDVVFTYGREIQENTNTMAEAIAILEALRYCVANSYTHIELQTDSMLLKNVMKGRWTCPWNLIGYVEDINVLMATCEVKVSHIMREGNKLADHLANYGLDFGHMEAHGFGGLDTQGRRIVNSDKLQCPYLRVRVARNS